MAEKRISELTAKGSNLQSTDLIEVSVDAGGGAYNTRYITGAQITGAVSSTNFANTDLTFTANRTHNIGVNQLTFQVSGTIGQYIAGSATRNLYINQSGSGDALFSQSTTGFAGDFLGGNGTAVRIQSNNIGLNSSGNGIGGFFKPLAAGGTGLWAVQDVGDYAAILTGTTKIVSPSASALATALTVRNNTDTDYLFKQLGNGEWKSRVTKVGGIYDLDYTDYGNGYPALILDSPINGTSQLEMRYNTTPFFSIVNYTSQAWARAGVFQLRNFTDNAIQAYKDNLGQWVFDNDATGSITPETDVRVKLVASSGKTALKTVGKVNFNTLPTSAVGLSAGDLWNNSGVINIV